MVTVLFQSPLSPTLTPRHVSSLLILCTPVLHTKCILPFGNILQRFLGLSNHPKFLLTSSYRELKGTDANRVLAVAQDMPYFPKESKQVNLHKWSLVTCDFCFYSALILR